ncbi:MAG TPA: arginine--tRNA ligase [Candidatus Eisenbacteria bacterium]|nr:arginine--tRNA ligase [Candidatus Eisenbacteria bacterium]
MRSHLKRLLLAAIDKAVQRGELPLEAPPVLLESPKQREFGDLASNVAMLWAQKAKRSPRAIAQSILKHLEDPEALLERKEVAGPGFLNFAFAPKFYYQQLRALAAGNEQAPDLGAGRRVQIEFASVNPTGPLHVGHGRVAVIGDVLARLHEATGYRVEREYYVNDAGNQMDHLAVSIYLRYRELLGERIEFPPEGYPGEYVKEIAAAIQAQHGAAFLEVPQEEALRFFRDYGGDFLLNGIREDLAAFGIRFDSFFSEKEMRRKNEVAATIEHLRARGLIYSHEGAEWFRSTAFGDDKDRTLVKSDGELTYFASDIAYHRSKFERGFDGLINVWGADHHGYVARIKAAIQALGFDPARLRVVLVQMVQLTRGGEPVRMGKRTGEFVSLREVLEEVGRDAARFFFLMRKADSHLDFDLDLAKRQSTENPVFYAQYAHARIASIFEQAAKVGRLPPEEALRNPPAERLELRDELELIREVIRFGDVLEESVSELEPHRLVFYLLELAGAFHRYYNRTRVLTDDDELTQARLALALAVQATIRKGLGILGVEAPVKMAARLEAETRDSDATSIENVYGRKP